MGHRTGAYLLIAAGLAAGCSGRMPGAALQSSQTMDKFTLIRTNLGRKEWSLKANRAELPQEGADIDLAKPHIEIEHADSPPTRAESETGRFIQRTQDIDLRGHVVVVTNDANRASTILRTQLLHYSSSDKKFRTDQPVRVERPGSVMRGVGLIANGDLSEIHILRQETTFQ